MDASTCGCFCSYLFCRRTKSQPHYVKYVREMSVSAPEFRFILQRSSKPSTPERIWSSHPMVRPTVGNRTNDLRNENSTDTETDSQENTMSVAMIATIGVYKKIISPLLPPACRFVPTCSSYGVQAIQEFGPTKGCILIAWRLLRCSPLGGKGYIQINVNVQRS
jgi:uncharacterized protein